jgi:flagellar protein FliT
MTASETTTPAGNAMQVIANYESLSNITNQMRHAAIQGEWDHLISLELQCSQQVALMKPLDASVTLDENTRQHKVQLIRKILADDAEIRNCTETWMAQLRNIMHSHRQEERLHHKYGV